VLTSFQRARLTSLEAGVKYLIIGALSTAFTVFGIALVSGVSGKLNFADLSAVAGQYASNKLFLFGLLLVMVGLGFKIAAFPFQIWAPDVYQGAPSPTTAFLAVGSKAAGFRPDIAGSLHSGAADYGSMVVVTDGYLRHHDSLRQPLRHQATQPETIARYSSVAHAGYMLLGVAAMASALGSTGQDPTAGASAILYYLSGYLFTVLGAFLVICLVMRSLDGENIESLAGLNQRSPLLAATLTLAMVSLGGIPPLAGFFGKFLLLKSGYRARSGASRFYTSRSMPSPA
jgi:NADH-quinone oxidoreductase subunit N